MSTPDWPRAARALLSGCVDLPDTPKRLALLEQVCRGLGDTLYPDFLTLLAYVGEHGDAHACGVVAATLLEGLRTGRVPSGRRQAWGASSGLGAGAGFGGALPLGDRAQPERARPDRAQPEETGGPSLHKSQIALGPPGSLWPEPSSSSHSPNAMGADVRWPQASIALSTARSGPWRSLGPLEYLCALQDLPGNGGGSASGVGGGSGSGVGVGGVLTGRSGDDGRDAGPREDRFLREGQFLLRLIDAHPDARRLYIERLRALADDPLEGGLSRQAREGLRLMAGAWSDGLAPDVVCQRYLGAMAAPGQGRLSALAAQRW